MKKSKIQMRGPSVKVKVKCWPDLILGVVKSTLGFKINPNVFHQSLAKWNQRIWITLERLCVCGGLAIKALFKKVRSVLLPLQPMLRGSLKIGGLVWMDRGFPKGNWTWPVWDSNWNSNIFYRILKGQYFGFKIFNRNENFFWPD